MDTIVLVTYNIAKTVFLDIIYECWHAPELNILTSLLDLMYSNLINDWVSLPCIDLLDKDSRPVYSLCIYLDSRPVYSLCCIKWITTGILPDSPISLAVTVKVNLSKSNTYGKQNLNWTQFTSKLLGTNHYPRNNFS